MTAATQSVGDLQSILQAMGREPRSSLLQREQSEFDRLAAPFANAMILFGAGFLGRAILQGLRQAGLEPIAFADNNWTIWGQQVEGIPVLPPTEAALRYGERACFVVTIFNGASARTQLRQLGCARVIPFAPLIWKYAEFLAPHIGIDLPHTLAGQLDGIQAAYESLSDERSRREFCAQLSWRYWLNYECLPKAEDLGEIYFPEIISPLDAEVFVDCGAFDGGTIAHFLRCRNNTFGQIVAFEPDLCNRTRLQAWVETLPDSVRTRVTTLPYAVANTNAAVSFNTMGSMASSINAAHGTHNVECRRLDDLVGPLAPSFIKMDVEGAEVDALLGASASIRRHRPALAICVYHRSDDLWRVPNTIRSIVDGYNFFLRRYAEECWELVCYAVPTDRLVNASSGISWR